MININYQKRKNQELFKTFEKSDGLFLSKPQNFIPIYKRFFDLNINNYNNINLNHPWFISNIHENIEENPNLFGCTIKNIETQKTKTLPIFFKFAPLLDPYKYLVGKYDIKDENNFKLPDLNANESNINKKIADINNAAYIDSFFLYLSSQLTHKYSFIHGIDFYGSFLSIKNDYKINVFDDLEYLINSDFFNKNKNNLFKIDDYEHLFSNEKPKLKPLQIEYNTSVKSNLSIRSLQDTLFDDVFEREERENNSENIISLNDLKEVGQLEDISQLQNDIFNENHNDKTTTLKSGSSCSSRTSLTSSNDDNHDSDEENEENSENTLYEDNHSENTLYEDTNEKDTNLKSDEDEDEDGDWEDVTEESEEQEEEQIMATIDKFPVQIICMEYCEDTFDHLILSEELTNEEWFSAFMQIIMILLTYQKTFSFTHNDLHTNNVMYSSTKKKFIYYKYKNIVYKVPTFGRLFKIIDFGRSIYKFNGNLFCSDSFQTEGEAATQYNFEPYFNKNKPRLEPNFSFDLCRLACSIFDYLIEDLDEIKDLETCEPFKRLVVEWCLDDKGINMLYKNNGNDRYPDFKLYKMIARHVHHHTPQAQLERPEFKSFIYSKNDANAEIVDIDKIPVFI